MVIKGQWPNLTRAFQNTVLLLKFNYNNNHVWFIPGILRITGPRRLGVIYLGLLRFTGLYSKTVVKQIISYKLEIHLNLVFFTQKSAEDTRRVSLFSRIYHLDTHNDM